MLKGRENGEEDFRERQQLSGQEWWGVSGSKQRTAEAGHGLVSSGSSVLLLQHDVRPGEGELALNVVGTGELLRYFK